MLFDVTCKKLGFETEERSMRRSVASTFRRPSRQGLLFDV
jgi:hypothetical protein